MNLAPKRPFAVLNELGIFKANRTGMCDLRQVQPGWRICLAAEKPNE